MNLNNQMYNIFRDMKKAYANGDISGVEQYARCWMQLAPENPFTYNTPEYEEFFQMQKCYTIWIRGDIDRKINRRRMVQHARQLCELNPKQPYVFDKKADQEEKVKEKLAQQQREQEKQDSSSVEEVEEIVQEAKKETILGVIPEEKTEKKLWYRFLHPWRKEGA